jgi:hypothetical protein
LAYHAVFARGWDAYVWERWRRRFFPAIVRAAPDLRTRFFYKRWFLDARSARFDLALGGVGTALATRSPIPMLASAPYLRMLLGHARSRRSTEASVLVVAAADLAADFVSLVAIVYGSARARTLVL